MFGPNYIKFINKTMTNSKRGTNPPFRVLNTEIKLNDTEETTGLMIIKAAGSQRKQTSMFTV